MGHKLRTQILYNGLPKFWVNYYTLIYTQLVFLICESFMIDLLSG
jgi:hypothetical protein